MTVTYTAEVATCKGLGVFWKLLFRWRGSIYKLLWPNLAVYSVCYFTLSAVYRFGLQGEQKEMFEKISLYCRAHSDLIPVSFVLGFYVSIVIKRWWDQYMGIPWPDNLAMFVSTLVHGNDERGRLMRRTILRYVNLCFVVTLGMMCPRVKKRFPTLDHLVEAGFLQPTELKIFEDLNQKTNHPKYWMPLVWAGSIVTRARKEGRVRDDFSMKTLIDGLCTFRGQCGGMLNYDWISIPLVYTQVVTLAVYIFFLATLMGHQFLDPEKNYTDQGVDLVVPIFTFLQFFFYMGWLKVAESLVNPFGEDDDDFEVNWLVDRNLQVSYLIVDEMHNEHPELVKDQYWDEVFPAELPYTAAAKQYQTGPPQGSTNLLNIPEDTEFLPMETVFEESELQPLNDDDEEVMVDLDDIQLDLENGVQKRKETHPMKILMARKFSVSSKLSVQSSSVVGGGLINGGSRCKTAEATEGIGRSLLGLSYSSSATKGISNSYRNKTLHVGHPTQTALRPSGRKSSVLSMLSRMFHRDDGNRGELKSNHGSNASLRSHRRGAFGRSISRVSCSQANSRTSINRENTTEFQDEIFKMSDLSLCSHENELHNPHQRQRKLGQQQLRQSKRRTSAMRLSSAEGIGDHTFKEENRAQGVGDETPSTVASTPGEGEKEGMFGRRFWMRRRKKTKDAAKEVAANEEEEVDDDEDFEYEEREEGEDNGIWFSKKKAQDAEKISSKMKEEASSSPTKYFRRGDAGVDDISLVSDSSVKTSFYHGSWDTLAGSKGGGSTTAVSSSPTVKVDNLLETNPLIDQDIKKVGKVDDDHLEAPPEERNWLLSSESWAGTDKVNAEIPIVGQSLGSSGPLLHHYSARVVVPKKSDLPLKHVFEPRQTSSPVPQNTPSHALRSRFTSQLARGIAQMAAVKQDPPVKAQNTLDNHSLNVNVMNTMENDDCDKTKAQDSKEKLMEFSSQNARYSDSLKVILAPQYSTGLDHSISFPSTCSPSVVDAPSYTLTEQDANLTSAKLSDVPSPVMSRMLHPSSIVPANLTLPRKDQDVISSAPAKSTSNFLDPVQYTTDSTFSDPNRITTMCEMLEDIRKAKDLDMDFGHQDELHENTGSEIPQENGNLSPDNSLIFQPHVPSTAIPVPNTHSVHDSFSDSPQKTDEGTLMLEDSDSRAVNDFGDAPMDVVRPSDETDAVVGRRRMGGLRDFVELEPIEENAEFGGPANGQNGCGSKNEGLLDRLDADEKEDIAPETSV